MQFCESSLLAGHNNPEDEDFRFDKSLRELKDLRSQLYYAADYCQSTYLNAPDKKIVLENTKEYVCRAVVTLVDHLGNVSANLDSCISKTRENSDAEIRLDCMLQVLRIHHPALHILSLSFIYSNMHCSLLHHYLTCQRLLSCEKYAHKLALTHLRWSVKSPRHHPRYISACKHLHTAEGTAEFGSTALEPTALTEDSSCNEVLLPVRDGLSILPKGPNPTFHFQLCSRKPGRRGSLQRAETYWLQGTQMSGQKLSLPGAETNLLQGTQKSGRRHSLQGVATNWLQSIQHSGGLRLCH